MKRSIKRLIADVKMDLTEKGKNRRDLVDELYDFVISHGGLQVCMIVVSSDTDRIEYKYNEFIGSYIGGRSSKFFKTWDQDNRPHIYNFHEHGYENLDVEAVYDIGFRLKRRLNAHTADWCDWVEVEDRGGTLSDTISFAMGNYGTTSSRTSKYKKINEYVLYSDEQWGYFLEEQNRRKQEIDSNKNRYKKV